MCIFMNMSMNEIIWGMKSKNKSALLEYFTDEIKGRTDQNKQV